MRKITFLHLSSPTDVCWKSLQERDKTFIQATERDTVEKAKLVPQRLNDTYLKYADTIKFYYRDQFDQDAKLAATWMRNIEGSKHLGTLTIENLSCYEEIQKIHDSVISQLGKIDLFWKETVEKNSQIFTKQEPVSKS